MKIKYRKIFLIMTTLLCVANFSMAAFAGAYYASDESGSAIPPECVDSITVSTEDVEFDSNTATSDDEVDLDSFFDDLYSIFGGEDALTPVGNLTLVDDILQSENNASVESVENEQKSKQFITVQSKNGNYFYIIIDRSGDEENVYFLNLVDENDLLALIGDDAPVRSPAVCSCTEKCRAGAVNISCDLCMVDMGGCLGKELADPEPETPLDADPEEPESSILATVLIVVMILVVGVAVVYYFYHRAKASARSEVDDDDDYLCDYEELEDEE